ncbi:hypothetical protein Tco_0116459 [Tanacetum coccineum]
MKPKRKDTHVPQSSVSIDIVADETAHKELGDSLVRAATTASSLKAEQNSGNITKTRSKATPNDAGSLGTTSGGGPRYALTVNPTIYTTCIQQFWATAKAKTVNGERQIQALVDKKKVIITETSVRSDL